MIELSRFDEEGQNDSMYEGEDQEEGDEELLMPPLELDDIASSICSTSCCPIARGRAVDSCIAFSKS